MYNHRTRVEHRIHVLDRDLVDLEPFPVGSTWDFATENISLA